MILLQTVRRGRTAVSNSALISETEAVNKQHTDEQHIRMNKRRNVLRTPQLHSHMLHRNKPLLYSAERKCAKDQQTDKMLN